MFCRLRVGTSPLHIVLMVDLKACARSKCITLYEHFGRPKGLIQACFTPIEDFRIGLLRICYNGKHVLQNAFFGRTILEKNTLKNPYKMRPSDKNSSKHGVLFPQLFAIYYAFAFLFEENLCQICIRNNKKCWSKRLLLHCI